MRRYFDTFYYEVSKIPHLGDKLQGSRMGLWFLDSGVDFFYFEISNFRQLQIFTDHMEVCTWKAWCPSILELSKVQSARNFGHWKAYHFRTRISKCIYGPVREMTAPFKAFQTWCAKRRSAVFCVRIAMWHTTFYKAEGVWNNREPWLSR